MKVTASSALAAFGEMNITETDGTERNQNHRNGKERNSGSRKHAGLVVPVWDVKKVSTDKWLYKDSCCESL